MSTSSERSEVRAAGRRARRSVEGAERADAERRLCGHVRSLHTFECASSVGLFVAHDGEPDLSPLVEELWQRGSTVALPVVRSNADGSDTMEFLAWPARTELEPGRFGIPVPLPGPAIEPDLLLVSLTAFDRNGNRMGRGAGYFDRYLADRHAPFVGIGFEVQRVDSMPVEAHDVPMPVLVTDLGVRFVTR